MKRFSLLLVLNSAILVACSFVQQGFFLSTPQFTDTPTVPLTYTPTPHLTATALANATQTIATLAAKSDFQWSISLFQDDFIDAQNNEFRLQRKPFILLVEISKPISVFLNALDSDSNFKKINAGMYADDNCEHGLYAFCSLGGMAVVTKPNELVIDKEFGEGLHAFDLDPRLGELGSQFTITDNSIIYKRFVSSLTMLGELQQHGSSFGPARTETPIEQFAGERLYLIFLAKYQDGNIISDDELRKIVLVFENN